MGTCQKKDCNNNIFSHNFCRVHQWMRTDEVYKKQKEYSKLNRKPKKQISPESGKRKVEHIRYLEQAKLFKQEHKDAGTYKCFISGEDFDDTIDGFCTIHHLWGRTGDYLNDKQYWILARNKYHLDVFHRMTISELKKYPFWESFLERLREKDFTAHKKLLNRIKKSEDSEELF